VRLYHEVVGDGPPVLLLHAGGFDGRMWQPLVARLADRLRLVVPDLREHGRTPLPSEPFAHADDVLALLDDLALERVVVVGASYGGGVALQLATAAPERVSALVLLAAAIPDHDWSAEVRAYWEQEEALLEAGDVEGAVALGVRMWVADPAVADLVADMSRTAFARQLGVDDVEQERPIDLAAIAAPTLAVSGGRDVADFAAIADRIAAAVPDARRAEVPDAGHLIALERPAATADLLAGFVAPRRA
jgi:3-oxoadipate enol-lactonase